MKVMDTIKEHPKVALGVLGVLVVIFLLSLRGNKAPPATVVTTQPTNVGQNTALQAAALNAQVQTAAVLAQASVQNHAIDAAQAFQMGNSNNATNVALATVAAQADTTKYLTDIHAQEVAMQTSAARAINDNQMSTAQQIATINDAAQVHIAQIAADTNTSNNQLAWHSTDVQGAIAMHNADVQGQIANATLGVQSAKNYYDQQLAWHNVDTQGQIQNAAIAAASAKNYYDNQAQMQKQTQDYWLTAQRQTYISEAGLQGRTYNFWQQAS